MIIGGLQPLTLCDFPGVLAAILFTRGCQFRCPYCHNPELVDPVRYASPIPWSTVETFLRGRTGRLQGIVITGGEPTLHSDLVDMTRKLKSLGFLIKLDTNGSHPCALRTMMSDGLVDFIAMDVKAPLARYAEVVRAPVQLEEIQQSIDAVIHSGVPHEFRTTFSPALLQPRDLIGIAGMVRGCKRLVVQRARPGKTLEPGFGDQDWEGRELGAVVRGLLEQGFPVSIR
jgi:pyruvate formate lyase activating enzyme